MASDQRPEVLELPTDDHAVVVISRRLMADSGWAGKVAIRALHDPTGIAVSYAGESGAGRAYAADVEDRFAGKADGFDEHYTEPRGRVRLDLVLERLNDVLPPLPARILDAGGGTGAFAIPLARLGYDVTVADQSDDWLEHARSKADAAGVDLDLVNIGLESLIDAGLGRFDAILCHAVLMYVEDPAVVLRQLLSAAAPGAVLSLLEKNRDGIALRPGLQGDYAEARRLLTERDSAGRLGVESRAYAVSEWLAMLHDAGWEPGDWVGIRLFSDYAPDELGADAYAALLDLERAAGTLDPFRQVSRLVHLVAVASLDRSRGR